MVGMSSGTARRIAPVMAQAIERIEASAKSWRVEQLLTHRAGLKREAINGARWHDMMSHFAAVLATPLANEPGGAMVYSNIGY